MEIKKLGIVFFAITVSFLSSIFAEELTIEAETIQESSDYYYSLKDDGSPLFTQVLKWEPVEYVSYYELEIQDATGTEVYRGTSVESSQSVSLAPGTYQYRIILYNLLGKSELKSQWIPLTIIKAEHPVIHSFSPGTLFLDEENFMLSVSGEDLMSNAQVLLVDPVLGITFCKGLIQKNEGNENLEVLLPWNKLDTGIYKIKIINGGGLFALSDSTLRVKLNDPYEFFITAGTASSVPIYENTFTEVWSDGLYPLGAQARVSFIYSKKRYGYFGFEGYFASRYFHTNKPLANITVNMNAMDAGIGALYKFRCTPEFFLLARAGLGGTLTAIDFEYQSGEGVATGTIDVHLKGGLAAQYLLNKHWLFEAGADLTHIFYKGQNTGTITPVVSAGYLF